MRNATLREARSTPYIGPDDGGRHRHVAVQQLINNAISEENCAVRLTNDPLAADTELAQAVLFNTGGLSSSSTDLSTLIQFYNDSADTDITAQWMDLYRAQRSGAGASETPAERKISQSANVVPTAATEAAESAATATSHENILRPAGIRSAPRTKNYSDSAENLYINSSRPLSYASSTSTIGAQKTTGGSSGTCNVTVGGVGGSAGDVGDKNLLNRSMDVLPRLREFRVLEKCCSVDLPTQRQIPSARLARSKEMPNIADVDDYD